MRQLLLVVAAIGNLSRAEAQSPAPRDTAATRRAVVTGVVYDSVAGRPLPGAIVQLARGDDRAGSTAAATSDSAGAYTLDGVAAGRYLIGFFHPALDSLGLEAPTRVIQTDGIARTLVDLAIPSAATITRAFCRAEVAPDSTGLVLGTVRDAETGNGIAGSTVVLVWSELVIGGGRIEQERRQVPAKTGAGGNYAICGVPADAGPIARAEYGRASTGFVDVRVRARGLVRVDFALARDSATAAGAGLVGTARLSGIVRAGTKTLGGATVVLWGTEVAAETNSQGRFELAGLPAGTRSVEVRYLGYLPKRVPVDLAPGQLATVEVTLDERTPVLEAVTVLGKANPRTSITGFLQRRQRGFGHFLTRQDIEKRPAIYVTDLLRGIPGVRVTPARAGLGYALTLRGGCRPEIYVDGMRIFTGFSQTDMQDDLNMIVRPEQVAGIEVYTGTAGAPLEYGGAGCGSVVIWTGPEIKR